MVISTEQTQKRTKKPETLHFGDSEDDLREERVDTQNFLEMGSQTERHLFNTARVSGGGLMMYRFAIFRCFERESFYWRTWTKNEASVPCFDIPNGVATTW